MIIEGNRASISQSGYEPVGPSAGVEPSAALTVKTAAIRIGEAVFTLPRPNRHHNVMWLLHILGVGAGQMHDSGFVLSDGTYAGRVEAADIALRSGQIETLISSPNLYSEDLWDGGFNLPNPDQTRAFLAGLSISAASPIGVPIQALEDQKPNREAIARIIDGEAFSIDPEVMATRLYGSASKPRVLAAMEHLKRRTADALSKADQILALSFAGKED